MFATIIVGEDIILPQKKSKDKRIKPSILALFVMINELMLTHHELDWP